MGSVRDQLKNNRNNQPEHDQVIWNAMSAKIGIDGCRQDSRDRQQVGRVGHGNHGGLKRQRHGAADSDQAAGVTSIASSLIRVEMAVPNVVKTVVPAATIKAPAIAYSTVVSPCSSSTNE